MTRATVTAAAGVAQVGRATIYRWITEGLITKTPDGTVDLEAVLEVRDMYSAAPMRIHRDTRRERYLR